MPALIRSAALSHYAELARSVGLDPLALLREARLPVASLSQLDLKIPGARVRHLFELSAKHSGVETFGLQLAETRQLSNLGPMALVVREAPTLRGALQAVSRYGRLHSESLHLVVEEVGDTVVLRSQIAGLRAPARQSRELTIGTLFRWLCVFLGPGWRARCICFDHSAPKDRSVHQRVFGRHPVEFDQEFNGIVCRLADLDTPNPNADPVMARYARQSLEDALKQGNTGFVHEVQQLILLMLPTGQCTVELLAQHLGVERRTVHRHLQREGKTFSGMVESARRELAAQYLLQPSRPLSQVGALLGFARPSGFSRWHSRVFGARASTLRKRQAAGANLRP